MNAKHTPGPWHRNIPPATKYAVIFAGRNEHVASIRHAKSGEEAEANHNLIAAAPELLAALEDIVKSLAEQDDEGMIEHARQMIAARAAIAKAKGDNNV